MLRGLLLAHLALALLLGAGLVVAAFQAVRAAADAAAEEDIASDIQLLQRRYREEHLVGIADEIEFRATLRDRNAQGADTSNGDATRDESVYLLVRSDGTHVVGNLPRWPDGVPRRAGVARFDGAAAAVPAGRILARATTVDGAFLLLVGHRQSSVDALAREFAPVALVIIAVPCLLALLLTLHVDRRYKARIAAVNAVFDEVRGGALEARVPTPERVMGDELDALSRNVNAALAEVAHMMRSLDAASQAAAHELNRELARLREEARAEGASRFAHASDQLIALLRQLLELSRIETGTTLDARRVDLTAIARETLQLYDDAFDAAGVTAVLDVAPGTDTTVHGHATLISGAIVNLVENAVKHSPPGGSMRVTLSANAHEVAIAIADEGPGSDAEDIGSLIATGAAPHAHVHPQGYGFGLRFVQAVAIRHGARVRIAHATPGLIVTLAFRRPTATG